MVQTSEDKRNGNHDHKGRFTRGNHAGLQFGVDRPPPPPTPRRKKDAWVRELEDLLRDSDLRSMLADRILGIALRGKGPEALKALEMIQTRIGGPVAVKVEGLSEEDLIERFVRMLGALKDRLPPEHHAAIAEVAMQQLADDEECPGAEGHPYRADDD